LPWVGIPFILWCCFPSAGEYCARHNTNVTNDCVTSWICPKPHLHARRAKHVVLSTFFALPALNCVNCDIIVSCGSLFMWAKGTKLLEMMVSFWWCSLSFSLASSASWRLKETYMSLFLVCIVPPHLFNLRVGAALFSFAVVMVFSCFFSAGLHWNVYITFLL
jgi:hypothetical protein